MNSVTSSQINWRKECTETMATMQRSAIGALSFIWFGMDTPKVISMLPKAFHALLTPSKWIATALKPCEAIAIFVKQIATVVEVPDKWLSVRSCELKAEQNKWKRWNKIAVMIHVTLDALLLIPNSWSLINLGKWAGFVGMTPFGIERVKEGFTMGASFCNVKAAPMELRKADAIIQKNSKRVSEIAKIKNLLSTPHSLKEINVLKAAYGSKSAADKRRIVDTLKTEIRGLENNLSGIRKKLENATVKEVSQLVQEGDILEKKIIQKREKLARMQVWMQSAETGQLQSLREVVTYKLNKCEVRIANADREKKKIETSRWYDISKIVVLAFHNLLKLGVALYIGPALGLSSVTIAALFFLGRWVTSLTTGICSVRKTMAAIRFKEPLKLPQTYLVRI